MKIRKLFLMLVAVLLWAIPLFAGPPQGSDKLNKKVLCTFDGGNCILAGTADGLYIYDNIFDKKWFKYNDIVTDDDNIQKVPEGAVNKIVEDNSKGSLIFLFAGNVIYEVTGQVNGMPFYATSKVTSKTRYDECMKIFNEATAIKTVAKSNNSIQGYTTLQKGILSVNLSKAQQLLSVKIYNISGQMINEYRINNRKSFNINLDRENFVTGAYFVSVKSANSSFTNKISYVK